MNKKGFTLVELLGIVIILAIIFSLSFPIYINLINKEKESESSKIEETLCLAGESYLYQHDEDTNIASFFQNRTTIDVQASTLISENYVKDTLFSNSNAISQTRLTFSFDNGKLVCELINS